MYICDVISTPPTLCGPAVMVRRESMLTADRTDLLTKETQGYVTRWQSHSTKICLLLGNTKFYL